MVLEATPTGGGDLRAGRPLAWGWGHLSPKTHRPGTASEQEESYLFPCSYLERRLRKRCTHNACGAPTAYLGCSYNGRGSSHRHPTVYHP